MHNSPWQYTEADLYKQLAYFCFVLDTVRCIEKVVSGPICVISSNWGPLCFLFPPPVRKLLIYCLFEWQVESNMRLQVEKELVRIRPVVEAAASTVEKFRDRCAYSWVQLKDLIVSF